jgi:hypothetical protein
VSEIVGVRVPYRDAGAAQRQAHRRAVARDLSEANWRVLAVVLDLTTSYSKLTDRVLQAQIVKASATSARTVRRSLRRLAEFGVIVFVPGLGAGHKTIVGVPPAGVKADEYLSALGLPNLAALDAGKADRAAGRKSGQPTRARGSREDVRGEKSLLDNGVDLEPSREYVARAVDAGPADETEVDRLWRESAQPPKSPEWA